MNGNFNRNLKYFLSKSWKTHFRTFSPCLPWHHILDPCLCNLIWTYVNQIFGSFGRLFCLLCSITRSIFVRVINSAFESDINAISVIYHYSDVIMSISIQIQFQFHCFIDTWRGLFRPMSHNNCLLNRLFRRRSKKISKLHVSGLCEVTGEFPHKGPVTRKMFPFDDVIMFTSWDCSPYGFQYRCFAVIFPKHWQQLCTLSKWSMKCLMIGSPQSISNTLNFYESPRVGKIYYYNGCTDWQCVHFAADDQTRLYNDFLIYEICFGNEVPPVRFVDCKHHTF